MMTREQQYQHDIQLEHMAAEFLDAHFYSSDIFDKARVKRYSDTYHQYGGVDVSVNRTNFDEKFKIKGCMNKVLDHVGIECSLINKSGYQHVGWFMNDNLSTDYYMLIGISADVESDWQLSSSDQISAADVLWVKKSELQDYIYDEIDKDTLKSNVEALQHESELIEHDTSGLMACIGAYKSKDGKYRFKYGHRKFWLTYSSRLAEKPVNLVIPRKTLESFKHSRHFIVTKEEVRKA